MPLKKKKDDCQTAYLNATRYKELLRNLQAAARLSCALLWGRQELEEAWKVVFMACQNLGVEVTPTAPAPKGVEEQILAMASQCSFGGTDVCSVQFGGGS